jgi:hypothetical protein
MKLYAATLIALFVAFASPAFAKEDCAAGFKSHMGKMSIFVDKLSANDLADVIRKSLDAYGTCNAGDSFSTHGVWDQIEAEAAAKAGH